MVSLTVKYYRGFQWGTRRDFCRSKRREVGDLPGGFSLPACRKPQADGSPDRMVRIEMLTTTIEREHKAPAIITTQQKQLK